jgi:membrane protein DedA with SNARE-associated domain
MLETVAHVVAQLGVPGIFLLMFAENVFPPIPSEAIMPVAGFNAARGELPVVATYLAGVAGAVLGNVFWYEGARAVGQARVEHLADRYGRYLGVIGEDVREASAVFRRWGLPAVFLCRFLPGPRTLISVPAGIAEMNRGVFYAATTLGTMGWTAFLMAAGWWLEGQWQRIGPWFDPLLIVIVAAVLGLYAWHLWRTRHRWRRQGG